MTESEVKTVLYVRRVYVTNNVAEILNMVHSRRTAGVLHLHFGSGGGLSSGIWEETYKDTKAD